MKMTIKTLSPRQQDAINSSGRIILKSCPGSGKTFVVANKMIVEMANWKYKNKGIALISFTNVAHEEVDKQIQYISRINRIGYPHYTGTIDSFISQYIFLPFGHLIMGCEEKPSIIQDFSFNVLEYSKKIWRGECYRNNCKPLDFYINTDGNIKNLKKDLTNCPLSGKRSCQTFKKYCYKHGYATYTDVVSIAIRVLKQYPAIGKLLANRFPQMIIDEAQDTSAYQMEIIDLLLSYGARNVLLIGDPDQAIYEWRDADPSIFLSKYINSDWKAKELNENYRCSQNICNATKIFSTLNDISTAKGETATSDFMSQVVRYDASNKNCVIDYFLELCRERKIEITPDRVAVLVRGVAGLIGKDYSQIVDLWQSQTAKLFSEAAYERDYQSIKRAISLVEKGLFQTFIDSSSISNDMNDTKMMKVMPISKWRSMVLTICKAIPSSDIPLRLWKDQIFSLIKKVSIRCELPVVIGSEIKIKTRVRDAKLNDFLDQPVKNFYARSFNLSYLNSTIHAVKGCTFEAVLLILGTNGKLTSNMVNTKPIESEEVRTAYVAMTRAKQVLVVAIPKTVKPKTLERFHESNWEIKQI